MPSPRATHPRAGREAERHEAHCGLIQLRDLVYLQVGCCAAVLHRILSTGARPPRYPNQPFRLQLALSISARPGRWPRMPQPLRSAMTCSRWKSGVASSVGPATSSPRPPGPAPGTACSTAAPPALLYPAPTAYHLHRPQPSMPRVSVRNCLPAWFLLRSAAWESTGVIALALPGGVRELPERFDTASQVRCELVHVSNLAEGYRRHAVLVLVSWEGGWTMGDTICSTPDARARTRTHEMPRRVVSLVAQQDRY